MLDDINRKILNILQQDARTSNAEIARQLGMAPSAILERIRKLETAGIIQGYEARINPRALGLGLVAFIMVRTSDRLAEKITGEQLAAIPEVQEIHHVAGDDCYLVKIRTADTESLGQLLREQFGRLEAISSTRTTIVLHTVKETSQLPISVEEIEYDAP
jgi:Lrp/AsnC family leucine-responsive transcriptional regulator